MTAVGVGEDGGHGLQRDGLVGIISRSSAVAQRNRRQVSVVGAVLDLRIALRCINHGIHRKGFFADVRSLAWVGRNVAWPKPLPHGSIAVAFVL